MPAAIWPSTASLPACTAVSRASRSTVSVVFSAATFSSSAALVAVRSAVLAAMRLSRPACAWRSAASAWRRSRYRSAFKRWKIASDSRKAAARPAAAPASRALWRSWRVWLSSTIDQPRRPVRAETATYSSRGLPGRATRTRRGPSCTRSAASNGRRRWAPYWRDEPVCRSTPDSSGVRKRYLKSGADARITTPLASTSRIGSPLRASAASKSSRLILTTIAPRVSRPASSIGAARK